MSEKKAFVFDTNFIIKNRDLKKVEETLKQDFSLYVPRICIEERVAQRCREYNEIIKEANELSKKYSFFLDIKILHSEQEIRSIWESQLTTSYKKFFMVIPYSLSKETFQRIINSANYKIAPFSDAKDSSDKGFKDCILWLSLLEFFKNNGENEIIFVTDDKAFLNKLDFLTNEFHNRTNKTIQIKPSSFYDEYCTPNQKEDEKEISEKAIPNLDELRNKINETFNAIRGVDDYNEYGDYYWVKTYTTIKLFDKEYIRGVFSRLKGILNKHLFEQSISAKEVLELDNRISNGSYEISINLLEEGMRLHDEICNSYPDYLDQLYEAIAKILNKNYEPQEDFYSDENLPF